MPEQLVLPEIEAFRKLDKELEKARETAKTHAVKKGEEAVAALAELGFDYTFGPAAERKNGSREIKDAPCTVCGFKTAPLHDARSHRGQEPKAPFKTEELKARGLTKA